MWNAFDKHTGGYVTPLSKARNIMTYPLVEREGCSLSSANCRSPPKTEGEGRKRPYKQNAGNASNGTGTGDLSHY